MIINGRAFQALVDKGASHNFLRAELAKELNLKVTASKTEVKAMNSKAGKATRVASLVHVNFHMHSYVTNFQM
jgi:predicted aspartyl protease